MEAAKENHEEFEFDELGLDERFNQIIQSMLVKFCHKSKTN